MSLANYAMALDEGDHRLFVVTRYPARLLVLETESGKIVQSLSAVGDCDDIFFDQARKRSYRSEEHTSELQSQSNLVCRLLLEKKKIDRTECVPELRTVILQTIIAERTRSIRPLHQRSSR